MMSRMQDAQPQKQDLFPRISRFITEKATLLIISVSSVVVLGGIGIEGWQLYENYQKQETLENKKVQLTKELQYWQGIARQFSNYRDVYFRIASLQYQLGDVVSAKKSLEKVLAIDPNFENARVLGIKIESK
ncbi:MAG TPA: hypothetical protein VLF20_00940 [Patescibacteria group bacterium]|nr:hypothetical protein [Patescibacteria group bacterium]